MKFDKNIIGRIILGATLIFAVVYIAFVIEQRTRMVCIERHHIVEVLDIKWPSVHVRAAVVRLSNGEIDSVIMNNRQGPLVGSWVCTKRIRAYQLNTE
jgi:hypothetical protein